MIYLFHQSKIKYKAMNTEQKPLYKALNEKMPKGTIKVINNHPVFDGDLLVIEDFENSNSFRTKYKLLAEFKNVRGDSFTQLSGSELKSITEYTALAVNNLDKLADALQAIIDCAFTNSSNTVEIGKAELRAAKEALNSIK